MAARRRRCRRGGNADNGRTRTSLSADHAWNRHRHHPGGVLDPVTGGVQQSVPGGPGLHHRRVSGARLHGVSGDDRSRSANELAGARASRRHRLRDLSLHEVLPVVLGLDARVSLLRPDRARRSAGDSRPAPPARRRRHVMRRILPLLLIVIVANVAMLIGVVANRSGEPDAVVTMTERELPLRFRTDRNSARELEVRIDWTQSFAVPWLRRQKLEELGFEFGSIPQDATAPEYSRQLPRRG